MEKTKESYKGPEKKLDKLQKRLEYFLANSPAVFYTCDFGGAWACTFMSQNIVNQLGYEPAMFCEHPNFWADHIHPDDRQRVFDGLPQLLEKGSHVHEYRFLNKEGTYRWMRDELLLIYDSEGKPVDCVGFWIDITEQKSAEEALRQSEERLQEAQHLAHVGSWDLDIVTNVLVWSDESYRIFEIDKNDFGASYEAFLSTIHPDDRKAVDETYVKSVRDRTPYEIVHRLKFPDGRVKFVQERCMTFYSVAGDPLRSIGTVQDITERKLTEERMQRQLQRLSALRSIDLAISSSLDIRMTLNIFIEHVLTQLGVDAGNVLLLNPHSNMLEYAAGQGFRTNALRHSYVRLGEGHAGVAALEKRIVGISDLREGGFKQSKLLGGEDFITYYGVPLVAKGHVKGVLEIFHRNPLKPDEEWFEFLDALALQAAIAIDNNSLFYELERSNMDLMLAYDSTIEGWSSALDYRDKETEGHSQRVTDMTVRIAREMGMAERELVHVRRGALLHDIGKMGIPDSILLKPGALTEEEWKIMRLHPVYSRDLLSKIAYLRPALDIPYCHHEKWDGTGYPRGLKRDQIPISARIFVVVDVWDALRSDRPYRPAWPEGKTLEHIRAISGSHFDPKVVDIFLKIQW
ncbi:MAG: PAS domain-containing protein [Nitrospiraceae bacterium]|nr:PAS domain-containing protein [Nitrospiraceae bacterium]